VNRGTLPKMPDTAGEGTIERHPGTERLVVPDLRTKEFGDDPLQVGTRVLGDGSFAQSGLGYELRLRLRHPGSADGLHHLKDLCPVRRLSAGAGRPARRQPSGAAAVRSRCLGRYFKRGHGPSPPPSISSSIAAASDAAEPTGTISRRPGPPSLRAAGRRPRRSIQAWMRAAVRGRSCRRIAWS